MFWVHFCINAKPEKTEKVEKFPQQAITQKIMVQNKEKEIKILKDLLEERNKNSNLYHFSFNNHDGHWTEYELAIWQAWSFGTPDLIKHNITGKDSLWNEHWKGLHQNK